MGPLGRMEAVGREGFWVGSLSRATDPSCLRMTRMSGVYG
jgi:hypothetical protein